MIKLLKIYWRHIGINYIYVLITMCCVAVELWTSLRLNAWRGDFWTSVEQRHASEFLGFITTFSLLAFTNIFVSALDWFYQQRLSLDWRDKLNKHFLEFLPKIPKAADNPDQRIGDGIKQFTFDFVGSVGLVGTNIVKLILFIGVLHTLSVTFFNAGYVLPALACTSALVGTSLTIWIGKKLKLVSLNFDWRKEEGSYRYGLARLRTGDDDGEHHSRFESVLSCMNVLLNNQKWLQVWTGVYTQACIILPILFLVPNYFIHVGLQFGLLMQAINAWGEADDSLLVLVNNWSKFTELKAEINRLIVFSNLLK